jgi:hypothetical protein
MKPGTFFQEIFLGFLTLMIFTGRYEQVFLSFFMKIRFLGSNFFTFFLNFLKILKIQIQICRFSLKTKPDAGFRRLTNPCRLPLAPFSTSIRLRRFRAQDRLLRATTASGRFGHRVIPRVAAAEEHRPSNGGGWSGPVAAIAGGWVRLRPAPGCAVRLQREPLTDRELESRRTYGGRRRRAGSRVKAHRSAPREEIVRRYSVVSSLILPFCAISDGCDSGNVL